MTTTTAFEIVTSPAAIEPASTFGLLYADGMHGAEVAREFRAAFKRAQKFGAFKGVKVSVTSDRFSGGSSVTVKILAAPFPTHDRRRVVANIRRGLTAARTTRSDRMNLLVAQLTMLANLWRRDESDSSTDYFNCNCYLSVDVDLDDAEEHCAAHALVAAESLRYAVACVERVEPLADDRPVEAVEHLARNERADAEALARAAVIAAPDSVDAELARAVLATLERVERAPWDLDNAFRAAAQHVARAMELAGRTAEEGRGVCDAALAA